MSASQSLPFFPLPVTSSLYFTFNRNHPGSNLRGFLSLSLSLSLLLSYLFFSFFFFSISHDFSLTSYVYYIFLLSLSLSCIFLSFPLLAALRCLFLSLPLLDHLLSTGGAFAPPVERRGRNHEIWRRRKKKKINKTEGE